MRSLSISLFDSSFIEIIEEKSCNCLILKWKKHVSSEIYKKEMLSFIQFMKQKKNASLIIDIRNLGALLEGDQEWTVQVFVADLVVCQVEKVCVIIPEDIFGALSMRTILKMALENIVGANKIKFNFRFKRLSTAKLWLEQTKVV
ncbi:MAG: hypothetical protein AB8B61_10270 [Cyclobacteriaceae bacterium]